MPNFRYFQNLLAFKVLICDLSKKADGLAILMARLDSTSVAREEPDCLLFCFLQIAERLQIALFSPFLFSPVFSRKISINDLRGISNYNCYEFARCL